MRNKFTIDIDNSINSGQVFLWQKSKNYWYGIDGQNILKINQKGKIQSMQNMKTSFLRKNDDIEKIIKSVSRDKTIKKAVKKYEGLRIFNQDPFQCMISFIISSNSNIQKIKSSLEKISRKFGKKVVIEDQEFFLFPKPEKIAKASISEIKTCGVGYRAPFIKEAAKMVTEKKINFEYLKNSNYDETKRNLRLIPGVGNKVADCIMLFSLNKLDAFPLDTWMIKILEKYYSKEFQIETKTITEKQYEILHEKIVDYFGPYCGFAQQFLFKMERENYEKKWL
ncbi:DNA glycosylase [Nitrosopumilus sp. Nsub]|uniref:DNA-3-methyladenine glycosylase 2 n=1 Tax=Nitrosopumilus sp. Nsub TaxID=1776294 RepID=UPI0008337684|nr:DNA glycosylase [Nitrosopumilus sp. Nsub]